MLFDHVVSLFKFSDSAIFPQILRFILAEPTVVIRLSPLPLVEVHIPRAERSHDLCGRLIGTWLLLCIGHASWRRCRCSSSRLRPAVTVSMLPGHLVFHISLSETCLFHRLIKQVRRVNRTWHALPPPSAPWHIPSRVEISD